MVAVIICSDFGVDTVVLLQWFKWSPLHSHILNLSLSHVWLFMTTMDCGPPGISVHGILQARTLEWVDISFSKFKLWQEVKICFPLYLGRCLSNILFCFMPTKNEKALLSRIFHLHNSLVIIIRKMIRTVTTDNKSITEL